MIGRTRVGGIAVACVAAMAIATGDRAVATQLTNGAVLSQDFDNVTPPALPAGWTATIAVGPYPLWATEVDPLPPAGNVAYVDDPYEIISDKRLDSPPFFIFTNGAQLRFMHVYTFRFSPEGDTDLYLDGGVLEISVAGGPFQDIVDAGGGFVSGGYSTATISGTDNPLAGRPGWVGPTTPVQVVVNLPPVGGSTVVLRWRMGSGSSPSDEGVSAGWRIDSVQVCDGYPCTAIPLPARFDLDTGGNGVWEPGEIVDARPYYYNNSDGTVIDFSGTAVTITGPDGPGGYEIGDPVATYPAIEPGALGGCNFADDCYSFHLKEPSVRPAHHWDAMLSEVANGVPVTWALHIGKSFVDTPTSNPFYRYIETIFHRAVTGGCDEANYCPDHPALRKQMAVFLLKSRFGPAYVPPPAVGLFADVPASDPFAPWIENLYNFGITGGCSTAPLNYCPNQPVLRRQMAVFLLKTLNESEYVPPPCQRIFADVTCPSPFADWIEDLYNRQIAAGCGNGDFCPDNPNTRGQMAVFLVKTFGLRLYGN
jgi:hypothetical protein